jgi:hypothetical protein
MILSGHFFQETGYQFEKLIAIITSATADLYSTGIKGSVGDQALVIDIEDTGLFEVFWNGESGFFEKLQVFFLDGFCCFENIGLTSAASFY